MNVLSINYKFRGGGAAALAAGLYHALLREGHTSTMLTGFRETAGPGIGDLTPAWSARIPYHLVNLFGLNYLGIVGRRRLFEHPFFAQADVVHLHNLHGGYFNYRWLPDLTSLKPAVWTLHDMWALTGHCSHSFDCDRWQTGCGSCPYPDTYPPIRMDSTRLEWSLKNRLYQQTRTVMITPSRWLGRRVRKSMLKHLPLHVVPNAVNTEVYAPRPSEECRQRLDLPPEKFILLFVAEHVNSPFKRFDFLPKILNCLSGKVREHILLLIMGSDAPDKPAYGEIPAVYLGFVRDEERKADIFGAADALLYPTKADNFPMVIQEALSCGCPVVAENVGGVGELVRPHETGLLVESGDAMNFAACIEALFINGGFRLDLAAKCRAVTLSEYNWHDYVQRILAVYQEAADRHRDKNWDAPAS